MSKNKSGASVRAQRERVRNRQKQQRRRYYMIGAVGIIITIGLFAFIRQINAPSMEDVNIPDSIHIPPNADGRSWGPVDAPVVIEEFSDFQ
jgi:hypothetical protein